MLWAAAFVMIPASPPVAAAVPENPSGDGAGNDAEPAAARRTFNPEGLKGPFKSFILEQETPEGVKARKPRTYLETVDLSQLELIAVIVAPEDSWAMVRDAKGIGYVVKSGTPIGLDGGQVHEIRAGELVIRSRHRDAQGEVVDRETVKRLVQ